MPRRSAQGFIKSFKELLEKRQALAEREKGVIASLNSLLSRMGYRVVAAGSNHAPTGLKRRGRGPGRPRKLSVQRPGMPAQVRRRGRPPKAAQ
jgi:hypothetical protein